MVRLAFEIEPWLKQHYNRLRQVRQFLIKETEVNGAPLAPWKWRFLVRGFHSDKRFLYQLGADGLPLPAYLSDLARLRTRRLNGTYRPVLNDKRMFKEAIAGLLRCPRTFGTVTAGTFTPADPELDPTGGPFHLAVKTLPTPFIIKPIDRGGGRDVVRVERVNGSLLLDDTAVDGADLQRRFAGGSFIVEEAIAQSAYAAAFYLNSVNTIRVLTISDGRTPPWIAFAVQRIGRAASAPTDNFNRGGLCAAIDLETGRLSAALCHTGDTAPTAFDRHPETGAPISGVAVPGWTDLKSAILDVVDRLPGLVYVGWDVALLDNGFMVIEANSYSGVQLIQLHQPLLASRRLASFYHERGVIRRRQFEALFPGGFAPSSSSEPAG